MAPFKASLKRPGRYIFKGLHTQTRNTSKKIYVPHIFGWYGCINTDRQGKYFRVLQCGAKGAGGEDQTIFSSIAVFKTLRNMSFFYSWPGYIQGQQRVPKVRWRCLLFARPHRYGHKVYTQTDTYTRGSLLNLASCPSWCVVLSWQHGSATQQTRTCMLQLVLYVVFTVFGLFPLFPQRDMGLAALERPPHQLYHPIRHTTFFTFNIQPLPFGVMLSSVPPKLSALTNDK